MALENSYVRLDEFLALPDFDSAKPTDDAFIERLLERCSREFDGDTGYWYYANQATRYYDVPTGGRLELDMPLLSVTTLTNGDGSNVVASAYRLYPLNGFHKTEFRLRQTSAVTWMPNTEGETEGVITVRGAWGYVDRTATDPESLTVISNSKSAVLMLALSLYKKRYGVASGGQEGSVNITGAGVVITPRDKSREYWALAEIYRRHL